jgi:two-component system sensor histidine kinase YesM
MVRIRKLSMHVKLAILVLGFVLIPFLVSGMIWYEKSTQRDKLQSSNCGTN